MVALLSWQRARVPSYDLLLSSLSLAAATSACERGSQLRVGCPAAAASHLISSSGPSPRFRLARPAEPAVTSYSSTAFLRARARAGAPPLTPPLPPARRTRRRPPPLDTAAEPLRRETHLAHRLGLLVSPEWLVRHRRTRLGRPHPVGVERSKLAASGEVESGGGAARGERRMAVRSEGLRSALRCATASAGRR